MVLAGGSLLRGVSRQHIQTQMHRLERNRTLLIFNHLATLNVSYPSAKIARNRDYSKQDKLVLVQETFKLERTKKTYNVIRKFNNYHNHFFLFKNNSW